MRVKKSRNHLEFESRVAEQCYSSSPAAYTAEEEVHVGALQIVIEKKKLTFEHQEFAYE
jgi:hypothetical protein